MNWWKEEDGVREAAEQYGWNSYETDWRELNCYFDEWNGMEKGVSPTPYFVDGYIAQAIMEAVERSSEYKSWDYILMKYISNVK